MRKTIATAILATLLLAGGAGVSAAATHSRLDAPAQPMISPLIDYSSFIKVRIESYRDTLEGFFRTVIKKSYDERNKEFYDMFNREAVLIDRA